MKVTSPQDVTQVLLDWGNGNQAGLERLMPLVDRELHKLAHHYMRRENSGHTLQTTAHVNEVYLKLIDQRHVQWKNRRSFSVMREWSMAKAWLYNCLNNEA